MSSVQPKGSLGKASGKFLIHEENESDHHGRAITSQRASVSLLCWQTILRRGRRVWSD